MKTGDMTLIAVMAALICIAGPLTIAVGPIPLSLASFAVYLAGAVLGSRRGAAAVLVYLLIGMIGVPVFSGFSGGFQKIAGVTGGYLIGYLPCAWISGMGKGKTKWKLFLCLLAGTLALYLLGTAWFMAQTGNGLAAALGLCVLPFLPGDGLKMIAVTLLVSERLWKLADHGAE